VARGPGRIENQVPPLRGFEPIDRPYPGDRSGNTSNGDEANESEQEIRPCGQAAGEEGEGKQACTRKDSGGGVESHPYSEQKRKARETCTQNTGKEEARAQGRSAIQGCTRRGKRGYRRGCDKARRNESRAGDGNKTRARN